MFNTPAIHLQPKQITLYFPTLANTTTFFIKKKKMMLFSNTKEKAYKNTELNWLRNMSHKCHRQLEGERVKKEQDLSLSAPSVYYANLPKQSHFTFRFN